MTRPAFYKRILLSVSVPLVILSIVSLFAFGLKLGIDFTGGSLLEVRYEGDRPTTEEIRTSLNDVTLSDLQVQYTENNGAILRFAQSDEATHQEVVSQLKMDASLEELRFDAIGPVIGDELTRKTLIAIGLSLLIIIIFIAIAFYRVSRPVPSWQFGLIAIITLFHDVLIVAGIFAFLGYLFGIEIGIPFVAAILTVVGYSVNDTIVVFDRVRENLQLEQKKKRDHMPFDKLVTKSIRQSYVRSINTSVTTLLVLATIYFFGGSSTQYFILALGLGIIFGTYSSLFLASPLLLYFQRRS